MTALVIGGIGENWLQFLFNSRKNDGQKKVWSNPVLNSEPLDAIAKTISTRPQTHLIFRAVKIIDMHRYVYIYFNGYLRIVFLWFASRDQYCNVHFLHKMRRRVLFIAKAHVAIFIRLEILKYSNGLITRYKP